MISVIALFSVIFLISSSCASSPVLILGTNNAPIRPALDVVTEEDFKEIFKKEVSNSIILVFEEQELSSEDLSKCITSSGVPCYSNLTDYTPKTYYTNVENPVSALKSGSAKIEHFQVNSDGQLNHDIVYEKQKIIFIEFKEIEKKNRQDTIYNHASIIASLYEEMKKYGNVICVYTTASNNVIRRKTRQATPPPNAVNSKICNIEGKVLLYFTELLHKSGDKPEAVQIANCIMKDPSAQNNYEIELSDASNKNKLELQITLKSGYWMVQSWKWNNQKLRNANSINVPMGFSYYCGANSEYTDDKKTQIFLNGLQIQAFSEKKVNPVFGDAWHCVGFTSAGIWSGLFVTFMLLGILSIGLIWLMDIKTMDRFDDPKGKTITINAGE